MAQFEIKDGEPSFPREQQDWIGYFLRLHTT